MDMNEFQQFVNDYTFYIILVTTAITYRLGFARPLPLLKSTVIYLLLVAGCVLLTVLDAFGLPMVEALTLSAVLLIIYRLFKPRNRNKDDQQG